MKKIISYLKKNYIMSIIIAAVILILIGSIIIINLIKVNKNKIELKEVTKDLYYYPIKDKINNTYNLKYENNKLVSIDNKESIYDETIYYYVDDTKAILPFESEIIFTSPEYTLKKLSKYSEIFTKNNVSFTVSEGISKANSDYLIYDGEDLYFFPENVTLVIDGTTYKLSSLSYAVITNGYSIIYDYAKDKLTYIDTPASTCTVKLNDYHFNLVEDSVVYSSEIYSIKNDFNNLETYKES